VAVSTLETTIFEVHEFLATMTQIERLKLSGEQAHTLAEAVANASRSVNIPALSPEKMAIAMLAWVAGRIYIPMARDVAIERAARAGNAPARPGAPVAGTTPSGTAYTTQQGGAPASAQPTAWTMPPPGAIQ
jgi:hypothetical protein